MAGSGTKVALARLAPRGADADHCGQAHAEFSRIQSGVVAEDHLVLLETS